MLCGTDWSVARFDGACWEPAGDFYFSHIFSLFICIHFALELIMKRPRCNPLQWITFSMTFMTWFAAFRLQTLPSLTTKNSLFRMSDKSPFSNHFSIHFHGSLSHRRFVKYVEATDWQNERKTVEFLFNRYCSTFLFHQWNSVLPSEGRRKK